MIGIVDCKGFIKIKAVYSRNTAKKNVLLSLKMHNSSLCEKIMSDSNYLKKTVSK